MSFLRNKLYHNVDNQVENVDNFARNAHLERVIHNLSTNYALYPHK